ncbi:MAG: hypothetical protein KF915_04535 [Polyangiaceae bacterium]|nr:hypothetical protein [Polyangiaceae bacterium]
MNDAELDPAVIQQVLQQLERELGVGLRGAGGAVPGWVVARLTRAIERAPATQGSLAQRLRDRRWLAQLADELRVGETRFHRDPTQWAALGSWLEQRAARGGRLRLLSAGCSTGEETWTLAMLCAELGLNAMVVGIDRSGPAIERAQSRRYPAGSEESLPARWRARYVALEDGAVTIASSLQASFIVRDLMQGPPPGSWDLILCKNVLIYFADAGTERVVAQLMAGLQSGGALVVARSDVTRLRELGLTPAPLAELSAFFAT